MPLVLIPNHDYVNLMVIMGVASCGIGIVAWIVINMILDWYDIHKYGKVVK
jgi:hypothetical protein